MPTARGLESPRRRRRRLNGIQGLQVNLNDGDNGQLNPLGINCLRNCRTYGNVASKPNFTQLDQLADDYQYVPVRRLALMMKETLYRSTQWAVLSNPTMNLSRRRLVSPLAPSCTIVRCVPGPVAQRRLLR